MTRDTLLLPPRYRTPRLIGRGGMADIFGATDSSLGREVAIKVLAERYARDEGLRARFTREALAGARLSGLPYTVTIYDVGEFGERPYIVMELAEGGTVADRMRDGAVAPPQALRWLEQAGAALDAAHAAGVVHRDVKPANMLLAGDDTVRVADFGIASAVGMTQLTETGTVLGTFGYLAPEQAVGGRAGSASDRYALAVVAYELLAGRRPFQDAGTGAAEATAAAHEPVPTITAAGPGLPAALDPVFERALARDPERRYPSCAELAGELRHAFAHETEPTRVVAPPTTLPATRVEARRRSFWPVALALLLLIAAGGALAAVLLTDGDGGRKPAPKAVVRTVTAQGTTVTVSTSAPTTIAASTPATTPPTTTASAPDVSGAALNDTAYSKIQAGDYQGALPLLEQAAQKLNGAGSLAEAYTLYNLALTRFTLGSCDGVADLLERSQQIQGHRKEIDRLRKDVKKGCR